MNMKKNENCKGEIERPQGSLGMLMEVDYIHSLDHIVLFLPSSATHLVCAFSLVDNNVYLWFAFRLVEIALTEAAEQ